MCKTVRNILFVLLFLSINSVYAESNLVISAYHPVPQIRQKKLTTNTYDSGGTYITKHLVKDSSGAENFTLKVGSIAEYPVGVQGEFPTAKKSFVETDGARVNIGLLKPMDAAFPAFPPNVVTKDIVSSSLRDITMLGNNQGSFSQWPGLGQCFKVSTPYIGAYATTCPAGFYLADLAELPGMYVTLGIGVGFLNPIGGAALPLPSLKMAAVSFVCCRSQGNEAINVGDILDDCSIYLNDMNNVQGDIDAATNDYENALNAAAGSNCFRTDNDWPTTCTTYYDSSGTPYCWKTCKIREWRCMTEECHVTHCNTCSYNCNPYSCNPYSCNPHACLPCWIEWESCCAVILGVTVCVPCNPHWVCNTCYDTCWNTCWHTCTGPSCSNCGSWTEDVCCPNPGEGNVRDGWDWDVSSEPADGAPCSQTTCSSLISTLAQKAATLQALIDDNAAAKDAACQCICDQSTAPNCYTNCIQGG